MLQTERLCLRHPRDSDAAAVSEYASDPEVTRYMDWPTHTGPHEAVVFLEGAHERLAAGTEFTWMIVVKADDRVIGAISCRMRRREVDFGYALNRAYWGQGFATEAARAIVAWASSLEHVNRVWATCDVDNIASARVLEKVGLAREGVRRRRAVKPNIGPEPRDAYVYAKVRRRRLGRTDTWIGHGSEKDSQIDQR
jgi:RimJ/RimL family protein N-acetyltransferase